ncbi:hypothetical protein [Halobaculum sp. MBLA0143]|uniref:hypothetical protein n=1 Tax=Halobaculum sp. MBLA0143 TaxID=3079933 RepID=UPI0035263B0B
MSEDENADGGDVVNIQQVYQIDYDVNVNVVNSEFQEVYSPDDFGGVVWKYDEDITLVIYNTGTVIGHGPTEPMIDDAFEEVDADIYEVNSS